MGWTCHCWESSRHRRHGFVQRFHGVFRHAAGPLIPCLAASRCDCFGFLRNNRTIPRAKADAAAPSLIVAPGDPPTRPSQISTEVTHVLDSIMSSDLGSRLTVIGVDVELHDDACTLPCDHEGARHVLSTMLAYASEWPGVLRITIYSAERPGTRQLFVAARSVRSALLNQVVMIGRRDDDRQTVTIPGLPANSRVTCFDDEAIASFSGPSVFREPSCSVRARLSSIERYS